MPYHPLADILDTYHSLTPLVQLAWLVVPSVTTVVIANLWVGLRREKMKVERGSIGFSLGPPSSRPFTDYAALTRKACPATEGGSYSRELENLIERYLEDTDPLRASRRFGD